MALAAPRREREWSRFPHIDPIASRRTRVKMVGNSGDTSAAGQRNAPLDDFKTTVAYASAERNFPLRYFKNLSISLVPFSS
jgi:hypothetical protein